MITDKIQREIIENFDILDDDIEMTLNYLMELGEGLKPLDDKYSCLLYTSDAADEL